MALSFEARIRLVNLYFSLMASVSTKLRVFAIYSVKRRDVWRRNFARNIWAGTDVETTVCW